ncbi:MAG TPA: PEP-CTERM sorting domain-containing protein, partial [Tepidisphaeraceae bacterium]
ARGSGVHVVIEGEATGQGGRQEELKMRISIRAVGIGILVGIGLFGRASLADVPAIEFATSNFHTGGGQHFSIGYTFTLTQQVTITALGVMDFGGTSITPAQPLPVALYYSNPTPNVAVTAENGHFSGNPVIGASVQVLSTDPIFASNGGAYTSGDGFRYHTLATPITLDAQSYEIQASNFGTGYRAEWSGITLATGVSGPIHLTSSTEANDTAAYQTNTQGDIFLPGAAGPNFLIAVPEPAALAMVATVGAMLIRRR